MCEHCNFNKVGQSPADKHLVCARCGGLVMTRVGDFWRSSYSFERQIFALGGEAALKKAINTNLEAELQKVFTPSGY